MKSFWGFVCLFACLNNVSVLSDQTENQVVEEGNPIIVENANSALLDFVQSSDFYEVQSNEIVYYVAWAENEGDDKYLIRTTEDFSFEYSFTANCHYYLQMKYLTNDSNILDSSVLRVGRLA